MRLIDADKLIDYFYYGEDDKAIIDEVSDKKIIDIIKSQSTAYDIGNVVEGLEKEAYSDGYNKAIDDFMNKLCDHCMQQTNECYELECPFCTDGCDIVNIAEQLKRGGEDES